MNTSKYLNEMEQGFHEALASVRSTLEQSEDALLNLPEAPGKWSMLQCIEHMSLATLVYTANVKEVLAHNGLAPAAEAYKGHWKGRLFAKMNAPKPGGEIPMKLKTFKTMDPPGNLDPKTVIDQFFEVHDEMISLINQSRQVNIDKVKIATALGPWVKLRLGEAYRFILAHTQRHVVQLKRIKNTVQA